jgi:hypothetical protein
MSGGVTLKLRFNIPQEKPFGLTVSCLGDASLKKETASKAALEKEAQ